MYPSPRTAHYDEVGINTAVENVGPTGIGTYLPLTKFVGKTYVENRHDDGCESYKDKCADEEFFHNLELEVDELVACARVEKGDGDKDEKVEGKAQGARFDAEELEWVSLAAMEPFFGKHEDDECEEV